jgi:hypothetical protein
MPKSPLSPREITTRILDDYVYSLENRGERDKNDDKTTPHTTQPTLRPQPNNIPHILYKTKRGGKSIVVYHI